MVFTYTHYKSERIQIMFNNSEATSELQKHEEKVSSDFQSHPDYYVP